MGVNVVMKKVMKKFISILFIVSLFIVNIPYTIATNESYLENISYIETLETFNNPERGFYKTFGFTFKPEGNNPPSVNALKGNLIHLRLNLGQFSASVNGVEDLELTEDMLNTFDTILKTIKNNGGTTIIRFAYDNFNGVKNLEPSLEMIIRHIEALSPVFYENKDVISYIELGFFGPWGEMHSSSICNTQNVSLAIDAMLKSAPEEIKIGVRTPNYYAAWRKMSRSILDTDITEKGTDAYRVGLYNDGYLGSESDLGTFANRKIETSWLYNQARHTFYGGEVVANYGKEPINTTDYISKEGFITHTTYLNAEWNTSVINAWKEQIYNGEDTLYQGETGYTYISNHLGYRFVVRSSVINDTKTNKNLELNLQIENVGFANLINSKKLTIILENEEQIFELQTDIDATTWNSEEITEVSISTPLPEDIELGQYNVYLRLSKYGDLTTDNNYQVIRFANENMWNAELGANYIGDVLITEVQDDEVVILPENPKDNEEDITPDDNVENDDNENKDPDYEVEPDLPEYEEPDNTENPDLNQEESSSDETKEEIPDNSEVIEEEHEEAEKEDEEDIIVIPPKKETISNAASFKEDIENPQVDNLEEVIVPATDKVLSNEIRNNKDNNENTKYSSMSIILFITLSIVLVSTYIGVLIKKK